MIRCAVCDDDKIFSDLIRNKIADYTAAHHMECEIDTYESGEELLERKNTKYHVYFLDMQMKELDGMKVAAAIRDSDSKAVIVFISGYIQYAARGYCVNAVRYILKPQIEEEFDDCMDAVMELLTDVEEELEIRIGMKDITLKLNQVLYIENEKRKVTIHMDDRNQTTYETYAKISELAARLRCNHFIYCHAAYLVNAAKIVAIHPTEFQLKSGDCVPISRQKYVQSEKEYYLFKAKSAAFL